MPPSLAKTLFAAIVFMASISNLKAQYVSSYNNSFTGPNLNRAKEEAYNRQMRDEQEKWRQQRYAEERKTNKYSYGTSIYDVLEKKPEAKKSTVITKPEPKKSKWDYVSTYINGLAEASLKGKSGYVDIYEHEIVPVIYDEVYLFWEGLSAVKLNGKYGYVNTKGKVIIPLKYDKAWSFQGGKANVVLNNKQTIIDKNGVELLPFKYESLYAYSDGLILAYLNKKMGFIDITGKELIPVKFDSVTFLVSGGKKMFLDGLHYYFDKGGKPMKNIYDEVDDYYSDGTAFVKLNNKWGKTDAKGKLITPLKYDARPFTRLDMTEVRLKNKFGFINDDGKEVIKPQFDTIYRGFDLAGQAIVGNGNQMFSIDKTGKKIKTLTSVPEELKEKEKKPSPFLSQYNSVGEFVNGLAPVEKNNLYGYINTKGTLVIPLKYDHAEEFVNGLASVSLKEKYGCINTAGKEVVAVKYENMTYFSYGLLGVKLNGKWGFVNTQGVMVIKPQFDDVGKFNKQGEATAIIKEVYYWIDRTGKILGKQ